MGDYADMTMERDFNDYIDSIDRNDYDDPFDGPHTVVINKKSKENQLPIKLFPVGDSVLLRRYSKEIKDKLDINEVVKIIRITEKAILFKFDEEFEDFEFAGLEFWMPKRVIYMKENELKVYYIKPWTTIKFINSDKIWRTTDLW
jgi:hypothetical protein